MRAKKRNKSAKTLTSLLALITATTTSFYYPSLASNRYSQQKREMGERIYPIYRILERIMQTNKFSQGISITSRARSSKCEGVGCLAERMPRISKEDNLLIWALQTINDLEGSNNATAHSSNNLIIINSALQNNLVSNTEALACVVAHEAAHIELNHSKQQEQNRIRLDTIASTKIQSAVANAYKAKQSNEMWAAFAAGLNAFNAGYASSQGNYASAAQSRMSIQNLASQMQADLQAGALYAGEFKNLVAQHLSRLELYAPQTLDSLSQMQGLTASLVKRTMRDVTDYIEEFALEVQKLSREHELEADRYAVTYLANAGLNPNKCIDVMELLHRNTGDSSTWEYSTHPGETERMNALREAIDGLSPRLKRKYKNTGPRFKYPLLPYVYDQETQVVRISTPGTSNMKQGKNNRNAIVDSVLGD